MLVKYRIHNFGNRRENGLMFDNILPAPCLPVWSGRSIKHVLELACTGNSYQQTVIILMMLASS